MSRLSSGRRRDHLTCVPLPRSPGRKGQDGAWRVTTLLGGAPNKVLSSPPLREPRAIRAEERTSSACQPYHRWYNSSDPLTLRGPKTGSRSGRQTRRILKDQYLQNCGLNLLLWFGLLNVYYILVFKELLRFEVYE